MNLRLQPSYVFSAQEPGLRHLALSVAQTSDQPVMLTSVTAIPHAGGGELIFTLSVPAQCSIQVMNIAGRVVRTLETYQVRAAGQNLVLWDGRANTGRAVPSGRYLLQVEAAATNGTVARALRTLNVMR